MSASTMQTRDPVQLQHPAPGLLLLHTVQEPEAPVQHHLPPDKHLPVPAQYSPSLGLLKKTGSFPLCLQGPLSFIEGSKDTMMPVLRTVIKELCPQKYGEGENPAWSMVVDSAKLQSPLSKAIVGSATQFSLDQIFPWSQFGNNGNFSKGPALPPGLKWFHFQVG